MTATTPLAEREPFHRFTQGQNALKTIGGSVIDSEMAANQRFNQLFGASSTFRVIDATPQEEREAFNRVREVHSDPVVHAGYEMLKEAGDDFTPWHQYRVMGAGRIVINRLSFIAEQLGFYEGNQGETQKSAQHANDSLLDDQDYSQYYELMKRVPLEQLQVLQETKLFDLAAATHDVGKADKDTQMIISKPGELSPEEQEIVARHPDRSADFIAEGNWEEETKQDAMSMDRSHHAYKKENSHGEKVEGRLKLVAQIQAYVDMIDAMETVKIKDEANGRSYRGGAEPKAALISELKEHFTGDYADLIALACFENGKTSRPQNSARDLGWAATREELVLV